MSAELPEGIFERELSAALREWTARYLLSREPCFLNLVWDTDMRFEEMDRLDSAVVLDSVTNPRRVVVQRIRGEIRYWLATNRDPIELSRSAECETGAVGSINDLASLCDEFLPGEVGIKELRTSRRRLRGG